MRFSPDSGRRPCGPLAIDNHVAAKRLPRKFLAVALAGALVLAGCGGSSGSSTTGQVTISHAASVAANPQRILFLAAATLLAVSPLPAAATLPAAAALLVAAPSSAEAALPSALPAGVDSMQIEFKDAAGNVVHGPVEVAAAAAVVIRDVPLTAVLATVDYLQNGGYRVATDDESIEWSGARGTSNPAPAAVAPSRTQWKAAVDADGTARLTVAAEDGQAREILLKGVAYSPAPIGFSNGDGPGLGDLFWDTPNAAWFPDYELAWKRDIENIRAHGFNAVRTYSMIANFFNYQTGPDGTVIPTQDEIRNDPNNFVRTHRKFLDEAWNNGLNPIYVIVGIPMPATIFNKIPYDAKVGEAARGLKEIEFWDRNFAATVEQMKDHPAVIGFTLFNELGHDPDAFGIVTGEDAEKRYTMAPSDPARVRHFWEQVEKYSRLAKSTAPDKLIGWANFDSVPFASFTVDYRKQYAKAIDFYGVNAFQPDQLSTTLGPWLKSRLADSSDPYYSANVAKFADQGDAARPVLLTEFGLPATGHRSGGDWLTIYEDAETIGRAADKVKDRIPEAFRHPILAGVFYFEWSDEWWKQDRCDGADDDPACAGSGRKTRWEGTKAGPTSFPNRYWDEEGFGLHSIALGERPADQPYANWGGKGGNLQVDILTPRTELLDAVVNGYRNAEQTRKDALGR